MEEKTCVELKMFEYSYKVVSKLNELPITIESVILARDYQDADRLFYWKILTEFTPREYAKIILLGTLDRCNELDVSESYNEDCHRGILTFSAILDGSLIRSIEKSMIHSRNLTRGNLHPGVIEKPWEIKASTPTFRSEVERVTEAVKEFTKSLGYPPKRSRWSNTERILVSYGIVLLVIFFILLGAILI